MEKAKKDTWLSIDTSSPDKIILGIGYKRFIEPARKDKNQLLLPLIVEKLKEEGKTLENIKYIDLVTESGSFTGLRVGATVANILGWVLNIKVNGKRIIKDGPVEPIY